MILSQLFCFVLDWHRSKIHFLFWHFKCSLFALTSDIFTALFQSTNSTSTNQGNITENPDLHFYQMVYGVMVLVMVVLAIIKCFVYTHVTLNAACKFHDTMFKKVLWSGPTPSIYIVSDI